MRIIREEGREMIRNDAEFKASHAEEARRNQRPVAPTMLYREDGDWYSIPTAVAAVRDIGPGFERLMALTLNGECSQHELTIGLMCRLEDMAHAPTALQDHLGDPSQTGNEVTPSSTAACLAMLDGRPEPARLLIVIGSKLEERYGTGPVARAASAVARLLEQHRGMRGPERPAG